MDFVLNGRTIALDPTTVGARVTAAPPGPIRTHWVEIDGRRWPPKQFSESRVDSMTSRSLATLRCASSSDWDSKLVPSP